MVTTRAGHAKKRAAKLAASARQYQHPPSYDHDVMVETAGTTPTGTPKETQGRQNNPAIHSPAPAFFVYYTIIGGAYRTGGGG